MAFNLFGTKPSPSPRQKEFLKKSTPIDAAKKKIVSAPAGRVSEPHDAGKGLWIPNANKFNIIKPDNINELIPIVRSLYKTNEDLGSVVFDLIQLTNTGHHIKFDQDIDPDLQDKMREHLRIRSKEWGYGTSGIDGLVNKFVAQIWIGGALSFETVPDRRLTQLEAIPMINPETIRFGLKPGGRYEPYQKASGYRGILGEYIKLNEATYSYTALWGDEDTPYGVPPFIAALNSISTQKDMKDNINHILNQLGLLGYLEAKMDKPEQQANESDGKYRTRLEQFLTEAKTNVLQGFKTGVLVGFQEDHEFEFKATTKNLSNVNDVFNLNQNQLANALKSPASFLGLEQAGGEGQLGIVFTKMLSQLMNVQSILSQGLERIYSMELLLAGYDFSGLKVEFNKSTITDDLKLWQGKEIKQRVLHSLWVDRIISSEQYADDMMYKKPYKVVEPPEPGETNDASGKKKEDREKDKDKSDRKGRDKKNPQPKRKDRETKSR